MMAKPVDIEKLLDVIYKDDLIGFDEVYEPGEMNGMKFNGEAIVDYCIRMSAFGIAEYLISCNAEVSETRFPQSVLAMATLSKATDKIVKMVRLGADLNLDNEIGASTPLEYALQEEWDDLATLLLNLGADPYYINMYDEPSYEHVLTGRNINARKLIENKWIVAGRFNSEGRGILHVIAMCAPYAGVKENVLEYLSMGYDPLALDCMGFNPVHYCCTQGNTEVFDVLVERIIDSNEEMKLDAIYMDLAISNGHFGVVLRLIELLNLDPREPYNGKHYEDLMTLSTEELGALQILRQRRQSGDLSDFFVDIFK